MRYEIEMMFRWYVVYLLKWSIVPVLFLCLVLGVFALTFEKEFDRQAWRTAVILFISCVIVTVLWALYLVRRVSLL